MAKTEVQVEAYSSFRYAVEPRAYFVGGERRRVAQVDWTWRAPDGLHFTIREENGEVTELTFDQVQDRWWAERFDATVASGDH